MSVIVVKLISFECTKRKQGTYRSLQNYPDIVHALAAAVSKNSRSCRTAARVRVRHPRKVKICPRLRVFFVEDIFLIEYLV